MDRPLPVGHTLRYPTAFCLIILQLHLPQQPQVHLCLLVLLIVSLQGNGIHRPLLSRTEKVQGRRWWRAVLGFVQNALCYQALCRRHGFDRRRSLLRNTDQSKKKITQKTVLSFSGRSLGSGTGLSPTCAAKFPAHYNLRVGPSQLLFGPGQSSAFCWPQHIEKAHGCFKTAENSGPNAGHHFLHNAHAGRHVSAHTKRALRSRAWTKDSPEKNWTSLVHMVATSMNLY